MTAENSPANASTALVKRGADWVEWGVWQPLTAVGTHRMTWQLLERELSRVCVCERGIFYNFLDLLEGKLQS